MADDLRGQSHPWTSEWNKKLKTGGTLSVDHRNKISASVSKIRKTTHPIWNKGLTKVTSAAVRRLGRTISKRTKGKPRPHTSKKQGKRRFWYYGPDVRIKMRSRWEVAYAHYLDKKGIVWLYEVCTFVMTDFSFTPDFYIPAQVKFVEIKGHLDPVSVSKIEALRRHYCTKLDVLCAPDLQALHILDARQQVIRKKGVAL
jgi:hypothetical protein